MRRKLGQAAVAVALAAASGCYTGVPKHVVRNSANATADAIGVVTAELDPCIAGGNRDSTDCQDVRKKLQAAEELNRSLEQKAQ